MTVYKLWYLISDSHRRPFLLHKNYSIYFLTLTDVHFDCLQVVIFIFWLSPTSILSAYKLSYLFSGSHRRPLWLPRSCDIYFLTLTDVHYDCLQVVIFNFWLSPTSILTAQKLQYSFSDSHRRPFWLPTGCDIYFLTLTDVHFDRPRVVIFIFLTLTNVHFDCPRVVIFIFWLSPTSVLTACGLWYLFSDSHRRPFWPPAGCDIYFLTLTDVHFNRLRVVVFIFWPSPMSIMTAFKLLYLFFWLSPTSILTALGL